MVATIWRIASATSALVTRWPPAIDRHEAGLSPDEVDEVREAVGHGDDFVDGVGLVDETLAEDRLGLREDLAQLGVRHGKQPDHTVGELPVHRGVVGDELVEIIRDADQYKTQVREPLDEGREAILVLQPLELVDHEHERPVRVISDDLERELAKQIDGPAADRNALLGRRVDGVCSDSEEFAAQICGVASGPLCQDGVVARRRLALRSAITP